LFGPVWQATTIIRFSLSNGVQNIEELTKLVDQSGQEPPKYFIAVGAIQTQMGPRPIMAHIEAGSDDEAFANALTSVQAFHREHSTSIVRAKPVPPPQWPHFMFPSRPDIQQA
jgi:hypothetical protein